MAKKTTPTFVLTLPLIVSSQDDKELRARFNAGLRLYNACLNEAEKRRKAMQSDLDYQTAKAMPKSIKNGKGKEIKNKDRSKAFSDVAKKHGYSDYDLQSFANQTAKDSIWIAEKIDSNTQQKLGTRAFKATQRIIFGNAKKVRFKGFNWFKSLEGKTNKQGLKFRDNSLSWCKLVCHVNEKLLSDWEQHVLSEVNQNTYPIKFCRVLKKWFNGKIRYYIQLVLEGISPPKFNKDGSFKHQTRDLQVGIDLNISNVAFVCEDGSSGLLPFAENVPALDKEIASIQRKMQRSQRVNNPDCFEPDFQKKKGRKVVKMKGKFKKGSKIKIRSKTYKKIARKKRELQRKKSEYAKSQNRGLVNQILSKGVRVQTENVLVKAWQKVWGRAISSKLPGYFQSELVRKAESAGGSVVKFSTQKTACSQTHLDGQRRKKKLSDRVHYDVTGPVLHRDIFSAFLALCVVDEQLPSVEELNSKFSAMEILLLQAWLESDSSEFKKSLKLKHFVEARLRLISNPLKRSAFNFRSDVQDSFIETIKAS